MSSVFTIHINIAVTPKHLNTSQLEYTFFLFIFLFFPVCSILIRFILLFSLYHKGQDPVHGSFLPIHFKRDSRTFLIHPYIVSSGS